MFPIPSLAACVQASRAAIASAQPGLNAWLWPNNIGPTAKVLGGQVWNLFNRLDFVGKQAFVLTATGRYLAALGSQWGLARKAATSAVGNIDVTVTAAAAVAQGALFQRGDGYLYAATAPASISGPGTFAVPVAAQLAGLAAVAVENTPMTVVSGLTGAGAVGATAAVDSNGLVGGADVEPDGAPYASDLSTFRGRILFRLRNPPMGGAPADYVTWCSAIPGVTRVYVEKCWAGAGTVRVFPLFDALFAAGIPDSAHLALVEATLAAVAPAGCALTVAAATPQNVPITITNLNPNTAAAQASVLAELADAFIRLGGVAGSSTYFANMAQYLATPMTFLAIWVEQAVANASGVVGADVAVSDTVISAGSTPVPEVGW